jgi:ubiquinone/menaquinone biosynthesis C-methylase UbiE
MAEMIERLLIDAGIGPGMRVLDVGCGRGDVALLAAKLVGVQGEVVGIDRDPGALELARGRVRAAGLTNVTFAAGDFTAIGPELDERLAAERAAANATYVGDMAFGAWARLPAK